MNNLIAQANRPVSAAAAAPSPMLMFNYDDSLVYPGITLPEGTFVLIETDTDTKKHDTYRLYFEAKTSHTDSFIVNDPGRAVLFVLPNSLIADNAVPGDLIRGKLWYEVLPATGPVRESGITNFAVTAPEKSIPPATTPGVDPNQFDPINMPEPGLTLAFPNHAHILHALWRSFGKNGRLLYQENFGVSEHVLIGPNILALTEPGGLVVIQYYSSNVDGKLGPSIPLVLRVIEK